MGGVAPIIIAHGSKRLFAIAPRIASELLKNRQKCPGIAPKIFVDEFWRDVFAVFSDRELLGNCLQRASAPDSNYTFNP
jgi:hypothetical protein